MTSSSSVVGVLVALLCAALEDGTALEPLIVTPPYLFGEEPPTPSALAASYGYPTEEHEVDSDGYLLTLFRIKGPAQDEGQKGKRKASTAEPPALEPFILHHGMAGNAAEWVMFGPGKSLAYALADAGFDVWLASGRGSKYGKKHVQHAADSDEFWDFSWHDQGAVDLPNIVDFVLNATNFKQTWYAGHSMGNTIMFVMNAVRPEYDSRIRHHFALAPTGFMGRVKNPSVVDFKNKLAQTVELWDSLGLTHFSSETPLLSTPRAALCAIFKDTCKQNFFFDTFGSDEKQSFEGQAEITGAYLPGDFSVRQVVHYGQIAAANESFRRFDFGTANQELYNSTTAPEYDMSRVTVPATFMYGAGDVLTVPEDVVAFSKLFRASPPALHQVPFKLFNHGDFITARDQHKYVHQPVLAHARHIREKTGFIPRGYSGSPAAEEKEMKKTKRKLQAWLNSKTAREGPNMVHEE
ncbi:lipase 3-like [Thrips palmi]|uniref:Lipase 3-like n=1 Tax=Thrips palmi TaxID=161013 RepID=A0A6P8Y407_THRPL|nr:lipase 3-like [Thrips palmi]